MFGFNKSNFDQLMDAIKDDNNTVAERAINDIDHACILEMQNFIGLTPLMSAIINGNNNIAEKLIDKMDNVEQKATGTLNIGKTALDLAVASKNYPVINKILDKQGGYKATLHKMIKAKENNKAEKLVSTIKEEEERISILNTASIFKIENYLTNHKAKPNILVKAYNVANKVFTTQNNAQVAKKQNTNKRTK